MEAQDRVAVFRFLALSDPAVRAAFFAALDAITPPGDRPRLRFGLAQHAAPRGYEKGRDERNALRALRGGSTLDVKTLALLEDMVTAQEAAAAANAGEGAAPSPAAASSSVAGPVPSPRE